MVKEVVSKAEFDALIKSKTVIVDFYAVWCGPCRMISPEFHRLAKMFESEDVVFIQVDVDKAGEIARFAGVSAMPTFKAFKNGKQVGEVVGANTHALKAMIEYHSKKN